jgi:hypothetical protein
MIRARISRDAPGAWAFSIVDADGLPFITGDAETWPEAWDAAVGELKLFTAPPELPLVHPDAQDRSWLARVFGAAA